MDLFQIHAEAALEEKTNDETSQIPAALEEAALEEKTNDETSQIPAALFEHCFGAC